LSLPSKAAICSFILASSASRSAFISARVFVFSASAVYASSPKTAEPLGDITNTADSAGTQKVAEKTKTRAEIKAERDAELARMKEQIAALEGKDKNEDKKAKASSESSDDLMKELAAHDDSEGVPDMFNGKGNNPMDALKNMKPGDLQKMMKSMKNMPGMEHMDGLMRDFENMNGEDLEKGLKEHIGKMDKDGNGLHKNIPGKKELKEHLDKMKPEHMEKMHKEMNEKFATPESMKDLLHNMKLPKGMEGMEQMLKKQMKDDNFVKTMHSQMQNMMKDGPQGFMDNIAGLGDMMKGGGMADMMKAMGKGAGKKMKTEF
jgi:hypothetical protein